MVAGENGWYDHDAWEQLQSGKAYVQFCLIPEGGYASFNKVLDVKFHGKAMVNGGIAAEADFAAALVETG